MNVYVESNFVLELALRQQQSESCQTLVDYAEKREITLVVPAYSLAEPYETIARQRKRRERVKREVDGVLNQLRRTDTYSARVDEFGDLTNLLISSANDEGRQLGSVIRRMLAVSEVIPLDKDIVAEALGCQADYGFSSQDALVYASVLRNIRRTNPGDSCFLNRDKDFDDQSVVEQLASLDCKLLFSFDDGLNFVRSRLD